MEKNKLKPEPEINQSEENLSEIKDKLQSLLEEYNLQTLQKDFLSYALYFISWKKGIEELRSKFRAYHNKSEELLSVLSFLYSNKSSEIKIDFKHIKQKISVSIRNQELIEIIKEALSKCYADRDLNLDVQDKAMYICYLVEEKKIIIDSFNTVTGRKRKYDQIATMIDLIQMYLQKHTEMKAEQGISISRRQALFIYKFLKIIDIIPNQFEWEEDNIRLILNKYREMKGKLKLKFTNEVTKINQDNIKSIKAKLKNINKKK